MDAQIQVFGANTHNLKNVNVTIPKHKLVVFTGVSGSGKSSLVFDTIYTEAQRQLIETFSTYARRRLPQLSRPPIDSVQGISPCIVIDQKRLGASSRSTVGTATEIYTYLRMLFSRAGKPFIGWSHLFSFNHPEGMCPACKGLGKRLTIDIDKLLDMNKSVKEGAIRHPDYDIGKWYYREILWANVVPFDVPLNQLSEDDFNRLIWAEKYPISYEDRGKIHHRKYDGVVRKLEQLHIEKDEEQLSGTKKEAFKRLFSSSTCPDCGGTRLNQQSQSVKLASGHTISDLVNMELEELDGVLAKLPSHPKYQQLSEVIDTLVQKMRSILQNLIDIGVGYLSLNRGVNSLSGGESQRVKMARQLDCDLVDMMYILDEPSIGLHAKDIEHLLSMLSKLRDSGNTLLVVEHDTSVMNVADWIVDVGPVAGEQGGQILYSGEPSGLLKLDTPTSLALKSNSKKVYTRKPWDTSFIVQNANKHNLKNITVEIPGSIMTCFTGVAGSGKSTLVAEFVTQFKQSSSDKVTVIDQKPIGRSNRANPATYSGIFDPIRKAFAEANNVSAALFSFNSKGTCPECSGRGSISMELSFMDDIEVECSTCHGKRYKDSVLAYKYHQKSIHDILELTVTDALSFFEPLCNEKRNRESKIILGLKCLIDVGLGYLKLGQSLSTLSGGEAQRLKLSSELSKGGNVYIMDEPSTGMHPFDTDMLLTIIRKLIDNNNTVIVIEHNLEIIAAADWLIDIGPNGGKEGGELVCAGTPEDVALNRNSHTGKFLNDYLESPAV